MHAALLANAGTAMVFAVIAYLYLANLFIGVFEGIVIAWRSRPMVLCIIVMVVANYISAFVGYSMLQSAVDAILAADRIEPLKHLDALRWLPLAGALVLSILIECVILIGAIRYLGGRVGDKSLIAAKASIRRLAIANCVTYAALAPLYFLATATPSDTGFAVVEGRSALARSAALPEVDMYFMRRSANSGATEVVVVPLRGGATERVVVEAVPERTTTRDRLTFIDDGPGRATLVVLQYQIKPRPGELFTIEAAAVAPRLLPQEFLMDGGRGWGMALEPTVGGVSPRPKRDRTVSRDFYGSVLEHRDVEHEIRIDLPVFGDVFSGVIDLGDGFALASVGNRVVLIDFETKQMAIIAEGFGPAVVLPPEPEAAEDQASQNQ